MAATPSVFTNAVKATALANAQAAIAGTWVLRESWDGLGVSVLSAGAGAGLTNFGTAGATPGERWVLPFGAGRIDMVLLTTGNWQATVFPGS